MLSFFVPAGLAAVPTVDQPVKTGARAERDAAVVIGIEDYFALPSVPYARADAQAFYDFLVYTRGVPSSQVQLLDGTPVKETILQAVDTAAEEAGSDGTVWVYFAGHGAASPSTSERVLLGADVQANLAVFDARALTVADVRSAATRHGGRAILVTDACYSGKGRNGADLVAGKRMVVPNYAVSSSVEVLEWSAAQPSQWSGPLEGAGHGAFTYAVLGALRGWADGQLDDKPDGEVTAEEADLYVKELLRTLQIRDQTPVMAAEDPRTWTLSTGGEAKPVITNSVASPVQKPVQAAVSPTPPVPPAASGPASAQEVVAVAAPPRSERDRVRFIGIRARKGTKWVGSCKYNYMEGWWKCPKASGAVVRLSSVPEDFDPELYSKIWPHAGVKVWKRTRFGTLDNKLPGDLFFVEGEVTFTNPARYRTGLGPEPYEVGYYDPTRNYLYRCDYPRTKKPDESGCVEAISSMVANRILGSGKQW